MTFNFNTLPSVSCRTVVLSALALFAVGCSGASNDPTGPAPGSEATPADSVDGPIPWLDEALLREFNDGDLSFGTPLRVADGLGPLYTRSSCAACHDSGVRGPGLVQKMSVVQADGVTPAEDQSKLSFGHTVHPLTAGGGRSPIVPPSGDASVKVSTRVGPPVIGRGYLEAVADESIERMAAEQAAKGLVHGRVNYVTYASQPNIDTRFHSYQPGDRVIGRFGLKARVATLDDFAADAFQGDMGITSPLRPNEFPNPDGLTDDDKPGIDVGYDSINRRAMYLRLLAIPVRRTQSEGARLFASAGCADCHAPSLRTRADYPVAELADIDAPIYSDLLLHQMGAELADGLPAGPDTDGVAGSFEWRTAPLIGLRFNRTLMHDGRATNVEAAILAHRGDGSEANASIDLFDGLTSGEREALVTFVEAL
jgi:CxxC motif-containing protein (DUF1111 family)